MKRETLFVKRCPDDQPLQSHSIFGCKYVPRLEIKPSLADLGLGHFITKDEKEHPHKKLKEMLDNLPPADNQENYHQEFDITDPAHHTLHSTGLQHYANNNTKVTHNYSSLSNRLSKKLGASHETVDDETRKYAVFSDATYHMHSHDINTAQSFIDDKLGKGKYIIDPETSTKHMLVVVDENDGKAIIAYKGSVTKGDWLYNALNLAQAPLKKIPRVGDFFSNLTGSIVNEKHSHIRSIMEHYEEVSDKYEVKYFTGHSKAGLFGLHMAAKHGIPAHVFNPEVFGNNHNILDKIRQDNTEVTIHRTTNDVASWGLATYQLKNDLGTRVTDSVKRKVRDIIGEDPLSRFRGGYSLLDSGVNRVNEAIDDTLRTTNNNDSIEVRSYPPLEGNEDPLRAHSMENFHSEEASTSPSNHRSIRGHITQAGIQGGINLLAGAGAAELANNLLGENTVDPELTNMVAGASANLVAETATRRLGMHSMVNGRRISLRNAFISGALAAESGSIVQQKTFQALVDAGLDEDAANIISSGSGGAASGAAEYASNVAIAFIEKKFGSAVLSTAVRTAIAEGVARVGLTETLSVLGGQVARNTFRGSRGGVYAAAIGAGIGLIWGAVDVIQAKLNEEKVIFMLKPGYNQEADAVIGSDNIIHNAMQQLNSKKDGTNDDIDQEEAKRIIAERIQQLKDAGDIPDDYNYNLDFLEAPEHILIARDKFITDEIDNLNRQRDGVNDDQDLIHAKERITQRINDMIEEARNQGHDISYLENHLHSFDIVFDESQGKMDLRSSYMPFADYSQINERMDEITHTIEQQQHNQQVAHEQNEEVRNIVDLYNRRANLTEEEEEVLKEYVHSFVDSQDDFSQLGHLSQVAEQLVADEELVDYFKPEETTTIEP